MQAAETFNCASGNFTLNRLPKVPRDALRAWDAADELLINTVLDVDNVIKPAIPENKSHPQRILIINDAFGALTIALHNYERDNWSDSFVSHLATKSNLAINISDNQESNLRYIPSTEELTGSYYLVLIKIPKTLSLLEDQLYRLKPYINNKTQIIAAGMSKHIHTSTIELFEKIIGTTVTSRATKKARLIFATEDKHNLSTSPYPICIEDDSTGLTLHNHANVFSKDKLDIGTRFFIENMTQCPKTDHIIDLACGNGALGIVAQRLQPQAKITYIDESYNAIASAKVNVSAAFSSNTQKIPSNFIVNDSLTNYKGEKAQLILCNPPFHQAHSIGDHLAWGMFKQSKETLDNRGELWIVGNRHLAYHVKLKKLFGNCRTVASNKKFVILAARKS